MNQLDTAIIIVNHDNTSSIPLLIESIYKFNNLENSKIYFIQNQKSEYIKKYLRNFNQDIVLIENEVGKGCAANINYGIKIANEQFDINSFLILNPDLVMKSEMLNSFKNLADSDNQIGMIGPKLLNDDGTLQFSCRKFSTIKLVVIRMFRLNWLTWAREIENNTLMNNFDHNSRREVDWIVGAVMFFKKSLIDKLGYFDEKNFRPIYGEDQDMCLRIWRNNLKVIYEPKIICSHSYPRRGSSLFLDKYSFFQLRSTINLFRKWNFNLTKK